MMTPDERKRLKRERAALRTVEVLQVLVIIVCGVVVTMDPHTAWGESVWADRAAVLAVATFTGLMITDHYKSKLPDL